MLRPMGLRLSEEKTRIAHIDEGFDFLGFRIQRQPKRGSEKRYVYTYPSKKALAFGEGQGAGADPKGHEPTARRPDAPVEPDAAGLDQLLPPRRVARRPSATCSAFTLAPGDLLAAPQASAVPTGSSSDGATCHGWWPTEGEVMPVQPDVGGGHPLPLPRAHDSLAMGDRRTIERSQ